MNLASIPDKRGAGATDVKRFGEDAFWADRYAKEAASFEWFVPLRDVVEQIPTIKNLLMSRVAVDTKQQSKPTRVVEIGCGTSELCENLWDMGFRDVTGLDNQPAAIEFCKKRQGEHRRIDYVVGDMTELPFPDKSVDVVIDKGALDALVCRGGDALARCGAELWRVLRNKDTSVLIVLSNTPLMEIVDGLRPWFEKQNAASSLPTPEFQRGVTQTLVRNSAVGEYMAKVYLFSRRKKVLK